MALCTHLMAERVCPMALYTLLMAGRVRLMAGRIDLRVLSFHLMAGFVLSGGKGFCTHCFQYILVYFLSV